MATMMWKLLLIGCVTLCYGKSITSKQSTKQKFLFSDVIPRNMFGASGFSGSWLNGDEITMTTSNGAFVRQNVETKVDNIILPVEYLAAHGWNRTATYRFSADGTKILVRYAQRAIFRHSTVSKFSVVNYPELGEPIHLADGEELQTAFFSPVGNGLAYIQDNNIFYGTLPQLPSNITGDGIPGVVYNGIPDWVYEEEVLGTDAASWFSPNGDYLAFIRFNDTEVHEAVYDVYSKGNPEVELQYPELVRLRYPKAGTTNPTVVLKLYNIATGSHQDLETPTGKVTNDHILGSVLWINDSTLGAIWMNRRQNRGVFVSYNSPDFSINEVMEINEPNGWIDVNTPKCNANAVCYFINNFENWPTLTSVDVASKRVEHHSSVGMNVLSIYGIDAKGVVYFLSTPAANESFNRHLYSTEHGCMTCSYKTPEDNFCTYLSATFSKDFSRYTVTCSGPDPATSRLFKTGESNYVDWELNTALREKLKNYDQPQKRIFHVPVQGGFQAAVMMIIPAGLSWDAISPISYPMLIRVYGGPGSVRIGNSFGIGFHTYQVSSKDVIYVEIDGRGTGQKGNDMMFSVNNKLGTFEMDDQIAVAEHLIGKYSFIDPKRVGIWGWSYGGYATAMTLAKDTKKVFKCGVSVAPVTNWKFYDTIYTERYMGIDSNATNYITSDVATEEHVKVIGEHDFFLIHGNADDNVHYQQSMVLARALELNDILFEQLSYPNEAHGISGPQLHLYHSLDRFWDKCFKP